MKPISSALPGPNEWCEQSLPLIDWAIGVLSEIEEKSPRFIDGEFLKASLLDAYGYLYYRGSMKIHDGRYVDSSRVEKHRPENNDDGHACIHEALVLIWRMFDEAFSPFRLKEAGGFQIEKVKPGVFVSLEPPVEQVSGIDLGEIEEKRNSDATKKSR